VTQRSSKSQAPSAKEAPISKLQEQQGAPAGFYGRDLFGIWSLGLGFLTKSHLSSGDEALNVVAADDFDR
jgi:hypothetical protein